MQAIRAAVLQARVLYQWQECACMHIVDPENVHQHSSTHAVTFMLPVLEPQLGGQLGEGGLWLQLLAERSKQTLK